MWYFRSPEVVFGVDALEHLQTLSGERAFIVTDAMMVQLGFVDIVGAHLKRAGLEYGVFSEVEPEPSTRTILTGAARMTDFGPDWVIGLGGGSAMDAAKAMWAVYENPGLNPEAINPFEPLTIRQKARLITIPTTSGTGSEVTWATVITSTEEQRKIGAGSPEILADIAIVDPLLAQKMPPRLTADTGLDALTHAIEGYTCNLHNDFTDGLCLQAIRLIFDYLPRAVQNGDDMEAREKMHNAATLAGLGFGNAMAALAHSLGHSLGALFHVPHGRAVALFLPYTIQFIQNGGDETRFQDISRFLGLPAATPEEGAASLVKAIRDLSSAVGQPLTLRDALPDGRDAFDAALEQLVANAEADTVIAMGARIPTTDETRRLFAYAYDGRDIDF